MSTTSTLPARLIATLSPRRPMSPRGSTTPGWASSLRRCREAVQGSCRVRLAQGHVGHRPARTTPPGAQLSLFEEADGWRYQLFTSNTPASTPGRLGQLAYLEARHRAHARVEDRIRNAKNTGLGHLPSKQYRLHQAWCIAVAMACDLLAWLRLLCLTGDLAKAEPKTLRYRLLHTAARIIRGQRRRKIRTPETGPGPPNCTPPSSPHSPGPNPPDDTSGPDRPEELARPLEPATTGTTAGPPATPRTTKQEVKITTVDPIAHPPPSPNDQG
jgi:Transposase DDE domain group 1